MSLHALWTTRKERRKKAPTRKNRVTCLTFLFPFPCGAPRRAASTNSRISAWIERSFSTNTRRVRSSLSTANTRRGREPRLHATDRKDSLHQDSPHTSLRRCLSLHTAIDALPLTRWWRSLGERRGRRDRRKLAMLSTRILPRSKEEGRSKERKND